MRLALIDIDNTLLDFDEYVRQTMQSGFAHFGLRPYEPFMDDVFERENNELWRALERGELTFAELKRVRWNSIFEALGLDFDGAVFEEYFRAALHEVCERYAPDRILIEPSGVGKLSDIVNAVEQASDGELAINALCTVVDAGKCKMYMRNFGEFFNNQVESAGCIILSRTAGIKEEKLAECVALLRGKNPGAVVITTPWDELSGAQILDAMEKRDTLTAALESIEREHEEDEDEHEHHHHHDHEHHHHFDENGNCSCGCHHDDDEDDDGHEHEHHHHDHDEHDHECGHDHEHHHHEHDEHDHDHGHECGCGHHHHHHGHDADEVFTSWGMETAKKFTEDGLRAALTALEDEAKYGAVLRAKGIVAASEGEWIHFDYTPGEINIRRGSAGVTGRLCVIGHELHEDAVAELFR